MLCRQLLHFSRTTRTIIIQQLRHNVSKSANVTRIYRNLLLACFIIGQHWRNHDEKSNKKKHWRQRHSMSPRHRVIKSVNCSIQNDVDDSRKKRESVCFSYPPFYTPSKSRKWDVKDRNGGGRQC